MAGIRKHLVVGENDLATLRPDLMKDWDWENNFKSPEELTLSSSYRARWVCHVCGHKWESRLDSRTKNMHGCPMCAKGRGSSVADYTLFKLLEMSLDCEVLYRYNVLVGCEADVYIPSKNIVVEYDGYGFHKFESQRVKDLIKEEKFIECGLDFYRIIERQDRLKEKSVEGKKAYLPEISFDSYDYLKDALAEVLVSWGIITYEDIPTDYFELSLEEVKVVTRKPNYSRSVACALSERDDIEWDYERNGSLKPEDVFRSVKYPKVWVKCKHGHSYETSPRGINDGFGCRVCMGKESSSLDNSEIAYNMSLVFKDLPHMYGSYMYSKEHYDYSCPFCGEDHEYRLSYVVAKSNKHRLDYCDCTKIIDDAELTILGKDKDSRVFYCLNVKERYFLAITEDIEKDILLSRLNVSLSDVGCLNINIFREYVGDPYVMLTSYNSQNTIPVNKRSVGVTRVFGNENTCYENLKSQKLHGIKKEVKEGFAIPVLKDYVVNYFKKRFEDEFGLVFAKNRTVGDINTSLFCKKLDIYFVLKLGSCKKSVVDETISYLKSYDGTGIFFLTSYKECVNEEKGIFYIPDTVFDCEYDELLSKLYNKMKNYYSL